MAKWDPVDYLMVFVAPTCGTLLILGIMVGYSMDSRPVRLHQDLRGNVTTYGARNKAGEAVIFTVDSTGKILCSKETQ